MRCIIFLFLFFASVQSIAQTEAETTHEGRVGYKILLDHGINSHCFTITNTSQGLFIGSRDDDNVPVNYLYTADSVFQKVDLLNDYIVLDFSSKRNILLLGKYKAGHSDSMCRELYTYNLSTNQFKFQKDVGWIYGNPKFSGSDNITFSSSVKKADELGSDIIAQTIRIK